MLHALLSWINNRLCSTNFPLETRFISIINELINNVILFHAISLNSLLEQLEVRCLCC